MKSVRIQGRAKAQYRYIWREDNGEGEREVDVEK